MSRTAPSPARITPVFAAVVWMICCPVMGAAQDSPVPTTAPATQPAATQPTSAVQAAVDQLTNDDFGIRQAAQQKLVEMGQAIEPQLRQLLTRDLSDEVRARVNGALRQIDENRLLGPAVITLHYQDAPLQQVLDDFSQQVGADLGVSGRQVMQYAKSRRATIDLDHADFLTAMQVLSQATGLRPTIGSASSMVLMPARNNANNMAFNIFNPHRRTVGAFTVYAISCMLNRNLVYGRGAADQNSMILQLMAFAEPKLHVIGPASQDWLKECIDEKGQSLIPDVHQGFVSIEEGRQWFWRLQTNLLDIHGIGKKIARLRGELKFTVQTKSEQIQVADLNHLDNLTRAVAGNSITLKQFTNDGGQYQLHVMVSGPMINDMEQVQSLLSTIQILDDQDEALQPGPMSAQTENVGTLDMTLNYQPNRIVRPGGGAGRIVVNSALVPRKLRWNLTTETRAMNVPFELDNLELPHGP